MYKYVALSILLVAIVSLGYRITNSRRDLSELVNFLQDYVRIDTTHPKPDYQRAISFLKSRARKDGFNVKELGLPSGRPALIITYPGSDPSLPSLVLNHHMDVVPASAEGWITPPFQAHIVDGSIIGRGTQDMKGIGAVHYFALKQLKNERIKPKRTIHIFAVPDEEIGGFTGTKELVESDYFKELNVGFVVDEGHASGDQNMFDLKVAERKPIQVRVFGKGDQAHGSKLHCFNAVHELVNFLGEITKLHYQQQEASAGNDPGKFLSLNISSLEAGIRKQDGHVALNMVPAYAQATIDIRVPAHIKNSTVKKEFEKLLSQFSCLEYKIEAEATQERLDQNYHTALYAALAHAIAKQGGATRPHYFEASSDLRFYHELGIDGIGFTPFTVQDNIHGINESVPIVQLEKAQALFVQFLHDFCVEAQ